MTMAARWTVRCDGLVTYRDQTCCCSAKVVGTLDESSHEVWRRALALGWIHDMRTGLDHCGRAHREGMIDNSGADSGADSGKQATQSYPIDPDSQAG